MAGSDDALMTEIMRLRAAADRLSYYDFLGVEPGCDYLAVRDAYHARARRFHPDRLAQGADPGEREAAYAVFKRMTEAYAVLGDPELRCTYDEGLGRGIHRLDSEARAPRLAAEERAAPNVFARLYLRSARRKIETGDVNGAWIDVELGLGLGASPSLLALRRTLGEQDGTKDPEAS